MSKLHIPLNREAVAAPVQRAAIVCTDVVAAALTAFSEGTLTKPVMPDQFVQFQIRGPAMTSDDRRRIYENWLLAKGFQDLARGVRELLEEAALYLGLISNPPKRVPSSTTLADLFDSIRGPASRLTFPELLKKVNSGLKSRIEFEQEFLSIQRVRNCLEHRAGIVRKQDLDDGGSVLTLSFPRLKIFYERGGEEIEIAPGERVDDGKGEAEVQLLARNVTRSRSYKLGERVRFASADFSEIAWACSFFGHQLAAGLPEI